jgi:hypothetical protein
MQRAAYQQTDSQNENFLPHRQDDCDTGGFRLSLVHLLSGKALSHISHKLRKEPNLEVKS